MDSSQRMNPDDFGDSLTAFEIIKLPIVYN